MENNCDSILMRWIDPIKTPDHFSDRLRPTIGHQVVNSGSLGRSARQACLLSHRGTQPKSGFMLRIVANLMDSFLRSFLHNSFFYVILRMLYSFFTLIRKEGLNGWWGRAIGLCQNHSGCKTSNPAWVKCRSKVSTWWIWYFSIVINEKQSTSPHCLSGYCWYRSKAQIRFSGVRWMIVVFSSVRRWCRTCCASDL